MDDSVCILYEKVKPRPDIEIVEEIVVSNLDENEPVVQPSVVDICEDSTDDPTEITLSTEEDDSIAILHENNRVPPKKLSVNGAKGNDSSSSREEKKTKVRCGICFDGPEEISASHRTLGSTTCGHIFCDACIASSMTEKRLCPTCRKRLNKKQFHPIYF